MYVANGYMCFAGVLRLNENKKSSVDFLSTELLVAVFGLRLTVSEFDAVDLFELRAACTEYAFYILFHH